MINIPLSAIRNRVSNLNVNVVIDQRGLEGLYARVEAPTRECLYCYCNIPRDCCTVTAFPARVGAY